MAAFVASLGLVVLSVATTGVEVKHVAAAAFLVATLAVAASVASVAAARAAAARIERAAAAAQAELDDRLFDAVAHLGSESGDAPPFALLSRGETSVLERSARAIWAYAIDLQWDVAQSDFVEIIHANLKQGKHYRYLIPDAPTISAALRELVYHNRDIPDLETRLEIRRRKQEAPFVPHAITIYNPRFLNSHDDWPPACVVLFPNYHRANDGFVRLSGAYATDYERAFDQLWLPAERVDLAAVIAGHES